jgi:23S rRNA (adenine-N6)-dimethyltransferase
VLDLGAGTGRLTGELARAAQRVIAVELDPGLAAGLRGRWPNVDVVQGDATHMRLPDESFHVVANLPFGRTNELLRLLLDDPQLRLERADVVVQWEVAVKRGLPWPSTANGVYWGAFYEMTVARKIPARAFDPRPAVDAGVLVMRKRPEPLVPRELAGSYRSFVARGFRHGKPAAGGLLPRDLDQHRWAALFLERLSRSPSRM